MNRTSAAENGSSTGLQQFRMILSGQVTHAGQQEVNCGSLSCFATDQ